MKPRIVFVGGGFAGLTVAKAFRHTSAEILLIDRKNHHLFQPLLYQVATAGLSPADIATPIRSVLRGQENTQVMMDEVIGIDVQKKHVLTQNRAIHYDYLIIATGSYHSYFGNDAWEHYAPGLKSIADAIEIRKRILIAFEEAEMETDYQKRQALLSFILIGGGPTGVEMAGSIAELAHQALKSDFRQIDPRLTRITLIEAGPQILFQFPLDLAVRAQKKLVDLGVELKTHSRVEHVDSEGVIVSGTRFFAKTVIWCAGVIASPAGKWLKADMDRAGRLIGDTAALIQNGVPLPGVASVANMLQK